MALQHTNTQRETLLLFFLLSSEYIPPLPLCWAVFFCWLSHSGTEMAQAVRAARSPWLDVFVARSLVYTVPIYPWKALWDDEGHHKSEEDECQGPSPGTLRKADFPICRVHLYWLAGTRPAACGGQAEASCDGAKKKSRQQRRERNHFLTHSKELFIISPAIFWSLLLSSYSSWHTLLSLLFLPPA